MTILSRSELESAATTAKVNEMTCVGCGMCVEICPYSAIALEEKKVAGKIKTVAVVTPALCKGCGVCASTCRSSSIDLKGFDNREVVNQVLMGAWEQ